MAKQKKLQDMTDNELAELRAGYDRDQQAAKAGRDFETTQEMREKKLEIQRELDRRTGGRHTPGKIVIRNAGNITSREKVDGLGG